MQEPTLQSGEQLRGEAVRQSCYAAKLSRKAVTRQSCHAKLLGKAVRQSCYAAKLSRKAVTQSCHAKLSRKA
eukprot:837733-Amorphochlora_amoeboformis.AAC.1